MPRALQTFLGVAVPLMVACSGAKTPAEPVALPSPNIILVTIDTLRPDHLSVYNPDAKTPATDELARVSTVFETAFCSAPLTLPSHASILTSAHPYRHGIRGNAGYRLNPNVPTLAEIVKKNEYRTGAFVGAYVLDRVWGLQRGFDDYSDQMTTAGDASGRLAERPAAAVLDAAKSWIRGRKQPWFAWIHLFDPHDPYTAPEPFRSRFAGRPYSGEVAYVDSELGSFWSFLREIGLFEAAVVAVTADHGESLGEHGERTHGFFIYDSTLRIPLILKAPGGSPGRSQTIAQSIDIAPTLLQLAGLPPEPEFQGVSLASDVLGKPRSLNRPIYSETYYPRDSFGWSPLRSLRDSLYKFIEAPRPELFAASDGGEKTNLAPGNAALVASYRQRLKSLAGSLSSQPKPAGPVESDAVERLKSLGYVAFSAPPSGQEERLPDPKDKLDLFWRIQQAVQLAAQGQLQACSEHLRAVVAEDPGVPVAWNLLGVNLMQQGRYREAILPLEKVMAAHSRFAPALLNLAEANRHLGEWQKARALYQRVLEIHASRDALAGLARVALDQKDPDAARRALSRLRELDPAHADLLDLEAMAARLSGNPNEAVKLLQQARAASPVSAARQIQLGQAYLEVGQDREAEAAFQKAADLDPQSAVARYNLAVLKLKRQAVPQARALLEEAVRLDPGFADAHYNLGRIWSGLREGSKAEAEYQAALKAAPDHFPSLLALASYYLAQRDTARPHPLLSRAIQLRPEDPQARYQIGLLYFAEGKYSRAASQFEIAVKQNPQFPEALTYLGACRLSLKETGAAIDLLSRASRLAPNYPSARYFLGQALVAAGRSDEGQAELRKAEQLAAPR